MKLTSLLKNSFFVFAKEIKETVRDRRTLFIMTLLPILLYPLLMLGMTQLIIYQVGQIQEQEFRIAVEGDLTKIKTILEKQNFAPFSSNNVWKDVATGEAVLGIQLPPYFERNLKQARNSRIVIYFSGANDAARISLHKLENTLQAFLYENKKDRLANRSGEWIHPLRLVHKNIAGEKKQKNFEFGRLLAMLLVLMAITFPLYPAIDVGAGEKERGTMETLLVSPATRLEIVLGKYASIFVVAMVGSLLNLLSMGVTFGYFSYQSNQLTKNARVVQDDSFQQSRRFQPVITENEPTLHLPNRIVHADYLDEYEALTFGEMAQMIVWRIVPEAKKAAFDLKIKSPTSAVCRVGASNWLLATQRGDLWLFRPHQGQLRIVWKAPESYITGIAVGTENITVSIRSGHLFVLDKAFAGTKTIPQAGVVKAFVEKNNTVFFNNGGSIWSWNIEQEQAEKITKGNLLQIFAHDYMLLESDGVIEIFDLNTKKPVFSSVAITNKRFSQALFEPQSQHLFMGDNQGTVEYWKVQPKEEIWELQSRHVLGYHDYKITQISTKYPQCLTVDSHGFTKSWMIHDEDVSFTISSSTILKMFITLIPLVGLFSALFLSLSVFSRSYKEGQHYLTPVIIVVMPLVMIAFLPNVELTPRLCLIPVANIVLLYKELFISGVDWSILGLVFFSTFFYACIALAWAVSLFQREDVLFRESASIRWMFWQKKKHHPAVFPASQAIILFLAIMVFYHFTGPMLIPGKVLSSQTCAMMLFLGVIPMVLTIIFRYRPEKTFFLRTCKIPQFLGTVPAALGGLLLGATLSVLQNTIMPIDTSKLQEFYKPIMEAMTQQPLWLILFCIAVVPGIFEELFFRGLLLSSLRKKHSEYRAVVYTAFCFALMHLDITRFAFTFTLGVILGVLAIRTGSIIVPMLVHAFSNATAVTLGYLQTHSELGTVHFAAIELQSLLTKNPLPSLLLGLVLGVVLLRIGVFWPEKTERME